MQGMPAFFIDHLTLCIHHIIIFQQSLPYAEVVFLNFFLGTFNRLGDHGMLDHLTFFQAKPVHDLGDSFRAKHTHQVIFERYEELRTARVSLSTGTAPQLTVYSP